MDNNDSISDIMLRGIRALDTDEKITEDDNDDNGIPYVLEAANNHVVHKRHHLTSPTTGTWYNDRRELARILRLLGFPSDDGTMTTPKAINPDKNNPGNVTTENLPGIDTHNKEYFAKKPPRKHYVNGPPHLKVELDDDEYITYLGRKDVKWDEGDPIHHPPGKRARHGSSMYGFLEPSTAGWWHNLPIPKIDLGPRRQSR